MNRTSLLLLGALWSINTFSYINNNINEINSDELIYCPDKVVCSEDGNKKSCKAEGGSQLKWWLDDLINNNGRIVKGVYKFDSAVSKYQIDHDVFMPNVKCNYKNKDNVIERYVSLWNDRSGYIESYIYGQSTRWLVNGYDSTCNKQGLDLNFTAQSCPFLEPYFVVSKRDPEANGDLRFPIRISANNIVIKEDNIKDQFS